MSELTDLKKQLSEINKQITTLKKEAEPIQQRIYEIMCDRFERKTGLRAGAKLLLTSEFYCEIEAKRLRNNTPYAYKGWQVGDVLTIDEPFHPSFTTFAVKHLDGSGTGNIPMDMIQRMMQAYSHMKGLG